MGRMLQWIYQKQYVQGKILTDIFLGLSSGLHSKFLTPEHLVRRNILLEKICLSPILASKEAIKNICKDGQISTLSFYLNPKKARWKKSFYFSWCQNQSQKKLGLNKAYWVTLIQTVVSKTLILIHKIFFCLQNIRTLQNQPLHTTTSLLPLEKGPAFKGLKQSLNPKRWIIRSIWCLSLLMYTQICVAVKIIDGLTF